MISNLVEEVEEDELMLQLIEESPYLNRAFKRGLAEGKIKRQAEIRLEAILEIRKEFIMDTLVTRFSPSLTVYRDLASKIRALRDDGLLKEVFIQVLQAQSIEVFQKWLLEHLPSK